MTKVANKPANKKAQKDVKGAIIEQLVNAPAKDKKKKVVATTTTKKPKAKKSIHDTKYGKEVLATNKALKAYEVSLNGAIGRLLKAKADGELKLTTAQNKILTKSKSKKELYKRIGELATPSSKGNYSPWKVLQKMYKHEEELVKLA